MFSEFFFRGDLTNKNPPWQFFLEAIAKRRWWWWWSNFYVDGDDVFSSTDRFTKCRLLSLDTFAFAAQVLHLYRSQASSEKVVETSETYKTCITLGIFGVESIQSAITFLAITYYAQTYQSAIFCDDSKQCSITNLWAGLILTTIVLLMAIWLLVVAIGLASTSSTKT
jgi:hypothetical protein